MEKAELQNKQKAFAIGLVSIVYGFFLNLTSGLVLSQDPNYQHYAIYINVAIFVPAIAAILFGKLIGAAGAAGGQFVNTAGSSLLTKTATATTATAAATTLGFTQVIVMASAFIGAYVVGSLTEKPSTKWDTFSARFGDMQTWQRLFSNTLGSIIGLGMFDSLLMWFGSAIYNHQDINTATSNFVKSFFLNSVILIIFIPITLVLYEFGDILVQMRAHSKDKSMRKIAKNVIKEEAVTMISARLTENALAEDIWTPIQVKFRANLDRDVTYKIEAVSTAKYYPAFDSTKVLKKGEIWEQKFFIMPSKQKNVDFKIRITPNLQNTTDVQEESIPETVVNINGKSYNPNSNSATLILFSIINTIMVGASVAWNNLIKFNPNTALASLQQSWIVILSTGGLEAVIMVPILMYLRRRWTKSDNESLTVGFGTDLSERSQKVYQNFQSNVANFFSYFGTKMQRSMKLFLIFVTTVSALLLGVAGYNSLFNIEYKIQYGDQLLIIAALAIVLWLGGYKGIDILRSAGIVGTPKYEIQDGDVLKRFKPISDFLENSPNEVAFTITNPTAQKGIRFRFLSQDTISPPLVEMPVPAGGSAIFKTSITPIGTGTRNLMVVAYPLFDEKGNYIDENIAEPFSHQFVNFQVESETQIGISKDQYSTLKKLIVLVGGLLALIYGGGLLSNQVIAGQSTNTLLMNNAPYLLLLQAPFVYAYFYIQNRSSLIKGEMESIIEQINTMDNIAKEMNDKLDKSIVNSRTFSKTLHTTLQTTMASVSGLSAMKQINDVISKQIDTALGDDFTQQIAKVVKNEDMTFFQQASDQIISENFSSDFQKIISKEESSLNLQQPSNPTSTTTSPSEPSADSTLTIRSLTTQDKTELQSKIKNQIIQQFGDKIKKQTSKKLSEELKKKSEDSFINQYKTQLKANLQKKILAEFKKQIKNQSLIDNIEEQVFETIEPEVQKQILDQLSKTVFNRNTLSSVAENLDSQLGTNMISEFEDSIGTATESEMGEKIKQQLQEKYEKEVEAKLQAKIKRMITRELNQRGDQIITDLLNTQLTTDIENKMISTLQETIADQINSVVNTAIDNSLTTLLGF